jgi:hypothetical protein
MGDSLQRRVVAAAKAALGRKLQQLIASVPTAGHDRAAKSARENATFIVGGDAASTLPGAVSNNPDCAVGLWQHRLKTGFQASATARLTVGQRRDAIVIVMSASTWNGREA